MLFRSRSGNIPYPVSFENISYWNLHFTSLNNNIYQLIKEQLNKEKFKIIKMENILIEKIPKISEVVNPLFYIRNNYDNESVLFKHLDINFL